MVGKASPKLVTINRISQISWKGLKVFQGSTVAVLIEVDDQAIELDLLEEGQQSRVSHPQPVNGSSKAEINTDQILGRRCQGGLNKGEAAHKLKRAVFFNQYAEVRDRSFDRQAFRASCFNLVVSAIVHWLPTISAAPSSIYIIKGNRFLMNC